MATGSKKFLPCFAASGAGWRPPEPCMSVRRWVPAHAKLRYRDDLNPGCRKRPTGVRAIRSR